MNRLAELMADFDLTEPTPLQLLADLGPLGDEIRRCSRFDLVAQLSSLFFEPWLQSNTLRIEALAHTAMAVADGEGVSDTCVAEAFNAMQKTRLSRLEDPAENVMTAPVVFQGRSYLLLNGIWESNTAILQRCLTVIEAMPDEMGFDTLKNCIRSLIALVDEACRRYSVGRYEVGNPTAVDSVNVSDLPSPHGVVFTLEDLDALDTAL